MKFTYNAYKELINLLIKKKYKICNYKESLKYDKVVILRHDVDQSIEKAVKFAELEKMMGVQSTYFVLLTSDFYNVCSKKSYELINKIYSLGHDIGLHFDETVYDNLNDEEYIGCVLKEVNLLSEIVGLPIESVSMHRPSVKTLQSDYKMPNIINSYSKIFFNNYKYLSDSRRHWREPVNEIINSEEYNKLHILTHPFWYNDDEISLHDTLFNFISDAQKDRYNMLDDNFRNLYKVIKNTF